MTTLKQKFVNGIFWKSLSSFSIIGLEFLFGLVLARILSPKEFGLIGMITILITLGQIFINSGFSQALIRKNDCSDDDYSTAFVFNLLVGLFFFFLIYLLAPYVSVFYEEPALTNLLRVLSLSLLISALTIIQRTTIIKEMNFKLEAKISLVATICSGSVALFTAFQGFGVWSLVIKVLSRELMVSILMWIYNEWKPSIKFSQTSFDYLFGFGSKLLISGIVGSLFRNSYYIIIGKFFSADALGFYTRAEMFKRLPSENISSIVTGVAYPSLAKIQNDEMKLKLGFQKVITTTAFVVFILMIGMMAVSENLIIVLIGEKWRQSIYYLQLLSIVGLLFPLNSININMLNVIGRSDLYMKLQFVIQFMTIPIIMIAVFFGIEAMIVGMIFNSLLAYFLFAFISGRLLKYTIKEQFFDLIPLLLHASVMGIIVYFIGILLEGYYNLFILLVQLLVGGVFIIISSEYFRIKQYGLIKYELLSFINYNKSH